MTATQAKPFSFDDLTAQRTSPDDAPAPSHADMAALEQAARDQAVNDIRMRELAKQTALLEELLEKFDRRRQDYDAAIADRVNSLSSGVREIIKRFCAGIAAERQSEIALSLLDTYIRSAPSIAPATIFLSRQANEDLRKRLAAHINEKSLDDFITVDTHKNLQRNDCRLEWSGGAMTRNLRASLHEIDSLFASIAQKKSSDQESGR